METQRQNAIDPSTKAQSRWPYFFGVFLSLFQIFISFPIAVWSRNKFNFEAPLTYSFSVIGVTLLALTVLCAILARITPRAWLRFLTPIFVFFATIVFIQQNFLNWDYGILDGKTLDFKKNTGFGLIDAAVWLAGIAALIFASKRVRRHTANILLTVGGISVILAGVNIGSYGPVSTPYTLDETAKFDFSRKKNVLVFMLDAYQMDVFLELSDRYPELIKPLEGFTVYQNNAAVFAKTYPTIPLFLTGKRYQKKEPLLDFFNTAYDDSLMQKLQDNGWDVGLYPHVTKFPSLINAIDINPSIMDNAIGGVPSEAKIKTYLQALDLSIFRAVPHALKPSVFNDGEFMVNTEKNQDIYTAAIGETEIVQPFKYKSKQKHAAVGFRDLINEHGTLATDEPVFRFYHFMLPHSPFILDGELQAAKHKESFESFREYSIAGLKLMSSYLERLKEIGAYDNATILIVSDHGMGHGNTVQYDPEFKDYVKMPKLGYRRASAKSILLVKNPNERGALKRSDKPVSGIDVAPTIAAAAGVKTSNFEGQDVHAIDPSKPRTRLFNFYSFSTWDSKYLKDFEAYEIKGDIRHQDTWHSLGIVKENTKIKNRNSYKIGQIISFGKDVKTDTEFLNAFIDSGKYALKPNYIQADDGIIDVDIKLKKPPAPQDALLLQFEIYSGETVDRTIIVNGHEMTTRMKPKMRTLNRGFFIAPDVLKGRKNFKLSFRPVETQKQAPLRLSSVKLSVLTTEVILPKEDLTAKADALFSVGFVKTKSGLTLPSGRTGALIFSASPNICAQNSIHLKLKDKPSLAPVVTLNGIPLNVVKTDEHDGARLKYDCQGIEITNNTTLEITATDSETALEKLSFESK